MDTRENWPCGPIFPSVHPPFLRWQSTSREGTALREDDSTPKLLDSSLFRQIGDRPVSLDERIVAEIRTLIDTGRISPGDRLPSERDLAHMLNVSRASLREALRRLAAMGLVDIRWGQGVFVRSADLNFVLEHMAPFMLRHGNITDLYEMRRLLEVQASGWAAERATSDERAELRSLTDEASARQELLSANAEVARDFDQRYHNLIAKLSHNQVLMRIMVGLLDLLAEVRGRSFAVPGRALRSLEEHSLITSAIVVGDVDAAREHMLRHLQRAEATVRSTFEHEQSDGRK
jgi:GntR family transcriptional repressor for pyruvate dehydrogenase complex